MALLCRRCVAVGWKLNAAAGIEALAGGEDDGEGAVGIVGVVSLANETRDGAIKVHHEPLAYGPLAVERFHVPAGGIEPDERGRQIDERDSPLAADLESGGRAKRDRFGPRSRHVAAAANLSDGSLTQFSLRREIQTHHAVIVAVGHVNRPVLNADDGGRFGAGDVAAPIDLLNHLPEHRRAVAAALLCSAGLDGGAAMAKDQLRLAEARGDQLFQAQRGRRQSPRELGHEGDACLFDALAEIAGLSRVIDVEGCAAIDALAMIAGGENGEGSVPLGGEDHNDVDIVAAGECAEAIHLLGREISSGLLGEVGDLTADGANLEAVG